MSYKLSPNGVIRLADGAVIPADPRNVDHRAYLAWVAAGNTAAAADVPAAEQVARDEESAAAPAIARQWFADHSNAAAFVRLTPAQRGTQIDGMNLAQLKEVLKFLVEAQVVQIKREML